MPLLLIAAALSTALLLPLFGLNSLAAWNTLPLAGTATLWWLVRQRTVRSESAVRTARAFINCTLVVLIAFHLGWWLWWRHSASSTAALLFVGIPLYALVAGLAGAAVTLLPFRFSRRGSGVRPN